MPGYPRAFIHRKRLNRRVARNELVYADQVTNRLVLLALVMGSGCAQWQPLANLTNAATRRAQIPGSWSEYVQVVSRCDLHAVSGAPPYTLDAVCQVPPGSDLRTVNVAIAQRFARLGVYFDRETFYLWNSVQSAGTVTRRVAFLGTGAAAAPLAGGQLVQSSKVLPPRECEFWRDEYVLQTCAEVLKNVETASADPARTNACGTLTTAILNRRNLAEARQARAEEAAHRDAMAEQAERQARAQAVADALRGVGQAYSNYGSALMHQNRQLTCTKSYLNPNQMTCQ